MTAPATNGTATPLTVLGCGVSGLTTAIRLLEAGFRVRIVTRQLPFLATSGVAAAIWHPYRAHPVEKVVPWAGRTLEVLYELMEDPGTGVSRLSMLELFGEEPEPRPAWLDLVRRRRRLTGDELRRLPADFGAAWEVEIPRIEVPRYLGWLLARFEALGGVLEIRPEGVEDLAEIAGPGTLTVVCVGLGAKALLGDDRCFPLRGQILRVTNPGVEQAVADEEGPLSVAYVLPRDRDVILGGTAEPGEWDTAPDPDVSAEIRRKAELLVPRLKEARLLEVKVGLRPGRTEVRLERQELPDGTVLIHNYGHGGAGYTLSWGCAEAVVELVKAG